MSPLAVLVIINAIGTITGILLAIYAITLLRAIYMKHDTLCEQLCNIIEKMKALEDSK